MDMALRAMALLPWIDWVAVLIFFAMFGFFFLMTQYFQLVLNYSPLSAGVRW